MDLSSLVSFYAQNMHVCLANPELKPRTILYEIEWNTFRDLNKVYI